MLDLGNNGSSERKKGSHKFNPQSDRGWIKFLLLRLLFENPKHGYQLVNEMVEKDFVSSERVSTGSIYIILNRMEKYGFLTSKKELSDEGRERRIYSITNEGIDVLKKGLETVLLRKTAMDDLKEFYNDKFVDKMGNNTNYLK